MRDRRELEGMVGYCLTPLVLRVDVHDDPSFTELLGRVRGDLLDGLSHQVPFERLVRELHPRRDPGANPVFQAVFVLEPAMVCTDPAWSLHQMEAEVGNAVGHAKFDLHLELDERPDGHLDGRLIYNTDLFAPDAARRIARHWGVLLEGIARAPSGRVSELPVLTEDERHRQLVEWNATSAGYPRDACVHELIGAQVQRTPDAVAVVFGDDQLTYRELDRRANQVAHLLLRSNAGGGLVAICVERSLEMVVGMLGILKCGAAYLPLDPHYPDRPAGAHARGLRRRGRAHASSSAAHPVRPSSRRRLPRRRVDGPPAGRRAGGIGDGRGPCICALHLRLYGQAEGSVHCPPRVGEPPELDGAAARHAGPGTRSWRLRRTRSTSQRSSCGCR